MKMIHFPDHMHIGPRPVDDYDIDCRRFYIACRAGNYAQADRIVAAMKARYGHDVADDAYSHGATVHACEIK